MQNLMHSQYSMRVLVLTIYNQVHFKYAYSGNHIYPSRYAPRSLIISAVCFYISFFSMVFNFQSYLKHSKNRFESQTALIYRHCIFPPFFPYGRLVTSLYIHTVYEQIKKPDFSGFLFLFIKGHLDKFRSFDIFPLGIIL